MIEKNWAYARGLINGYNKKDAPSIALQEEEHWRIPNIKGNYEGTARDLIANDARNLRNYTNAPNNQIQELIE